ncbi:MAG: TlpA family protein disulfide reductase [Ginsengibacter sp.]
MKKKFEFLFLTSLFAVATLLITQRAPAQTIPEFKVKLTTGASVSSTKASHQKPLLLIYFAPDCDHCRKLMDELFPKMNALKNTEILMVTFESLNDVAWFENHYHTKNYPNIKVGVEQPVFFLKNYYRLEHTPFTALFDKNGKLLVSYKEFTPVGELMKWVKEAGKK